MLEVERIASRVILERSEFPANSTHSTAKGSSLEIPATFDSRWPRWSGIVKLTSTVCYTYIS